MNDSAKISSIDAVTDFRVALIRFSEEVTTSLMSLQMEVNRSQEWIESDRPTYWKRKARKQYEAVTTAKQEFAACKRRGTPGNKPSCIEEEKKFKKAQRRLQEIEEIVETIPRWKTKLSRDADEYKARIGSLQRFVDNDLQKAILLLERMTTILDEYTHSTGAVEVESAGTTTQSTIKQPTESKNEEVANTEEINQQE